MALFLASLVTLSYLPLPIRLPVVVAREEPFTHAALAWRTLGISAVSLGLAFAVWFMWSAITVKINDVGFGLSKNQPFTALFPHLWLFRGHGSLSSSHYQRSLCLGTGRRAKSVALRTLGSGSRHPHATGWRLVGGQVWGWFDHDDLDWHDGSRRLQSLGISPTGRLRRILSRVLAICAASGLGNGSVFKIIPLVLAKEAGAAIGVVSCIGALGGFVPPLLLGWTMGSFGSPAWAYTAMAVFALLCLAINGYFYHRSSSPTHC